jgi:lipopolysaccharide biosynthesis regulator YciM
MISTAIVFALKALSNKLLAGTVKEGINLAVDQLSSVIDQKLGEDNIVTQVMKELKADPESKVFTAMLDSSIKTTKLDEDRSIQEAAEHLNSVTTQYQSHSNTHATTVQGVANGQGAIGVITGGTVTQTFNK